ncbi:XRE family transcriptional regulator [Clostridium botulinum]|uniref:helix-turn-helix domain-containing protein n=1 Tax=Clostridium botulinum TaxID=1491 RepID=UPI0002D7AA1E|nr:helix-turn-helix transcriptional regulator [Clostridium botulinum]AXG90505.1 XRE family transcriptional regulator [Clostridium botulinum]RFM21060.1 XRE family transcriptional regulator [Clostridium botulinum]RFM21086.1 XRE family transcriptional regulator [Clostridium botulinum]
MIKCNLRMFMAKDKIDTVTELMYKSGLSRNAINRIYKENAIEKADLETLITLCDTFKCKLSDLIEYDPNK